MTEGQRLSKRPGSYSLWDCLPFFSFQLKIGMNGWMIGKWMDMQTESTDSRWSRWRFSTAQRHTYSWAFSPLRLSTETKKWGTRRAANWISRSWEWHTHTHTHTHTHAHTRTHAHTHTELWPQQILFVCVPSRQVTLTTITTTQSKWDMMSMNSNWIT